jgi:hypothetical protein
MNQTLLRIKSHFSDILIFHCQNVKSEIDYFFASFHPSRTMKFFRGKKIEFFVHLFFYNKNSDDYRHFTMKNSNKHF